MKYKSEGFYDIDSTGVDSVAYRGEQGGISRSMGDTPLWEYYKDGLKIDSSRWGYGE